MCRKGKSTNDLIFIGTNIAVVELDFAFSIPESDTLLIRGH